jgi:hypothetical protein
MTSKLHIFAAALAGVLICSVAGAQGRNAESSARRPSVRARSTARASSSSAPASATGMQTASPASVIQISPSGRVSSVFAPGANSFNLDNISGVPGLGFDFPHLAAINGALGNNPSFRTGRHGERGQGAFVPILFGGYPYYYDDSGADQTGQPAVQQTQPQQPQIIVIQQPAPAQQNADSSNDAGSISGPAPAPQAETPVPDVGDFIFVRRDGRILFASVFSVVGTQLQYVTPEGIRHTLSVSDLDAGATQEMNEARGTTVQLRN